MVPPKRIPAARRLRDHKYCRRYTEAGQERHGVLERADVPIIEGEGGHVQKLVSTLDAFHELAQAHHFAVPRTPSHLYLDAGPVLAQHSHDDAIRRAGAERSPTAVLGGGAIPRPARAPSRRRGDAPRHASAFVPLVSAGFRVPT